MFCTICVPIYLSVKLFYKYILPVMIRQITKYQINYFFKYFTGNWLRIYSILKKDVIELYKKYFI